MKFITNNKILYFVAFILLVIVCAFVFYTYVHNKGFNFGTNIVKNAKSSESSNVVSTITNHVNVFKGNNVSGVNINIPGGSGKYFNNQVSDQSADFTTYTYQNFFYGSGNQASLIKPRVKNVLSDLLSGFNYATSAF